MVKRPYPRVRLSKREIFRRDGYRCQYCGQSKPSLTLDHVVPRHRGGEYSWTNLVTACPACNLKKGGRTIEQANMRLLRKPIEPRATATYLYGGYVEENSEWEQFLRGW
ncbi:MAG: HNH endonuclease [Anaerolineales bacterium]